MRAPTGRRHYSKRARTTPENMAGPTRLGHMSDALSGAVRAVPVPSGLIRFCPDLATGLVRTAWDEMGNGDSTRLGRLLMGA
ncbi:hypothetical protein Psi02_00090 [Planotetraspora silvatica]|uniref:Uncharacterized protein n=1 Tax=Planotetraspora silvatica TaxID=234614 RepID=A0A8J3UF72_9ACTN|nr:hypothetical protein Psi02_00090 [Planotetraspora silvatica]